MAKTPSRLPVGRLDVHFTLGEPEGLIESGRGACGVDHDIERVLVEQGGGGKARDSVSPQTLSPREQRRVARYRRHLEVDPAPLSVACEGRYHEEPQAPGAQNGDSEARAELQLQSSMERRRQRLDEHRSFDGYIGWDGDRCIDGGEDPPAKPARQVVDAEHSPIWAMLAEAPCAKHTLVR